MKINECTAISTSKVLLVPYDRHHVLKYHAWMDDAAIQEATASERLTLEEEYENQESWRASRDKLTFIICQPATDVACGLDCVEACTADSPDRMIGDINFFLYPWDEEEDDGEGQTSSSGPTRYIGEVDIMIADPKDRGKGLGRATVATFLHYIVHHSAEILREYASGEAKGQNSDAQPAELRLLMVKIKASNEGSIALFNSLGFTQQGGTNYFGEIKMTLDLDDFPRIEGYVPEHLAEVEYRRSTVQQQS